MSLPTPPDLDELLAIARRLALEAGALTLDMRATARLQPDHKSSVSDLVTAADRASEAFILDHLREHRPGDGMLGEEGTDEPGTTGVRWVIDPIDGTSNYVHDLPGYSVSIAAEFQGQAVVGVVYDPKANECFSAVRGRGAELDGIALACSTTAALDEAIVGLGFSYHADRRRSQAQVLVHLAPLVGNFRRLGSAALDLAYVAAGRLDGYYEGGLAPWDTAAGTLIATEAGAIVTTLEGTRSPVPVIVAASATLHARLASELSRAIDEAIWTA